MSDTKNKSPLMLTVSGLRGVVGDSLTPQIASGYGSAFARYLKDHCADKLVHVVVGRDSRQSGQMLEDVVVGALAASGCKVTRLGIVSTPGVAVMLSHLQATGALVITASHNPGQWNGIKPLVQSTGRVAPSAARPTFNIHPATAPPPDEAQKIMDRFNKNEFSYVPASAIAPTKFNDNTAKVHRDVVLSHVDHKSIRAAKFKVILDSVRGAGSREAVAVLDALGAWHMAYGAEPTGRFSHPPEPTKENLEAIAGIESLTEAVKIHGADVGFAQDPDADRLAVIDEKGRYIGEEYTLALCAKFLLKQGGAVAANLSTSRMIDDVAKSRGATVIRTPVGEANVAHAMRENGAVVGGEGNGGIIFAPVSYIRDSVFGIAAALALLAEERRPLSEIVDDIPAYTIVKEKIDLQKVEGTFKQIQQRLVEAFASQKIDLQDGIRIDWPDKWLHIRPSNTEPIVRIIAEAPDAQSAKQLIATARKAI